MGLEFANALRIIDIHLAITELYVLPIQAINFAIKVVIYK